MRKGGWTSPCWWVAASLSLQKRPAPGTSASASVAIRAMMVKAQRNDVFMLRIVASVANRALIRVNRRTSVLLEAQGMRLTHCSHAAIEATKIDPACGGHG